MKNFYKIPGEPVRAGRYRTLMFRRMLVFLGMVIAWSWSSAAVSSATVHPDDTTPVRVIYKRIDTLALYMDVYTPDRPAGSGPTPAMVFFFGGGWNTGSTGQFEQHARYFSGRGLTCFLVDYRVKKRNGTTPFESLKDAKSAIRYIKEHAAQFHIDTSRIIAAGGSAGGHLAAATAVVPGYNDPQDDLSFSSRPAALVLFNPVIDNGPDGYGYNRLGEQYRDFSPLHQIREGVPVPPTIFFLGTRDKLIPVETAERYKAAVEEAGGRCDVILYEGQPHGFFNYKNIDYYRNTVYEADRFLISLGFLKGRPLMERGTQGRRLE